MKFGGIVIFIVYMSINMKLMMSNNSSEGVPSAPPANVHVNYVGPMSITVKWNPVPAGSRNGRIQGYMVKYGQLLSNGSYSEVKYLFEEQGHDATLTELETNTEYGIEVAGVTSAGIGVYSNQIQAQTNDPCVPDPCLNGGTCFAIEPNAFSNDLFYCLCAANFTGALCASFVSDLPCHSPNVSLPNLASDLSSVLTIRRSSQFLIQSDVSLNCELSHKTAFIWNVYQLNDVTVTPVLTRNSSSELRITPHLLPVGVYLVRLTINMVGTPVFGASEGYFKIISSPLVALIAGGSKVVRGFNRTLTFNASMSYDPDDKNRQLSSLNFTWTCRQESSSGLNNSTGCYNTGDVNAEFNDPVLRVNSSLMVENSSYFITVFVRKDNRQAEYTQEVFIVPGDPPEVNIRCVDNCDVKLNPSSRVALQGICEGTSCGGTLTYSWSLFKDTNNTSNETQWADVSEIQQLISTRLSSTTLVTHPAVLMPNARYKFVLTAKRPGGYPGYSEYQVTTNSPPAGGTCSVNPPTGVTLTTEFTFTCSDWQDADLPLQYEFVYITDNNLLNVVYKGAQTSKVTKLPAGVKTNNFTIDFRVRVADMFGAFTEVQTPVQVLEPSVEAADLVDVVANLTTGEGSELTSLIQSGDLSSAVQLASAAITAVDAVAQTEAENQEELKQKRIAMKASIVQQLSAVEAETVVRVQQVSNVIAQATSVISEVTVEAQTAATDALKKMAYVLKKESTAGESFETLFDGAKSLVTGFGSMLRVSSHGARAYESESLQESPNSDKLLAVPSAQHSQRRKFGKRSSLVSDLLVKRKKRDTDNDAKLQSKDQVLGMLNSLDEVGSTILSRTLVGEAPRVLSSQSMSLLVSREEPDLLAGSVLSNKGGSFTLPSGPSLFGNGTQFVDSQVRTTNFMPFTWDPSGARVTTGVSSLVLKNSTGHLLNMTELESPISITLPNSQDLSNSTQSHYVGANKTVYHKINVTQSGMALMLKLRPENNATEFLVSVKYMKRPSLSNSDFNVTLPDFSSCASAYINCSRDPYLVFLSSDVVVKTGVYYIGITAKSGISGSSRVKRCTGGGRSKRSCVQYKEPTTTSATYLLPQYLKGDENYTMQVIPAACLYWNAEASNWTTEGCTVAETTTEDSIHCSCNHLSSFGGQLFVAPNPIDFDKVFTELTRLPDSGNVAVIIAVSCVFGIYLLLLLWARKADKLDLLKLGEKAFVGRRSVSSHVYEIQISTGIWRNSGTTANVYIMLEGELGTSRPYHLKDTSCIPFARGSVISFILSIPINIGPVQRVRVWHDNSGDSPSWFLNHINVCDISTHEQWAFLCFTWLAVDKGDGLVDRSLCDTSTTEKGTDFMVYVQNRIAEEFSDEHLWFSVATRPPRHRFTRVQRLSSCLLLMLTTMLASAMFYQFDISADNTQGTLRLGRFVINLRELIIAVQSLVVIIPVNLLVVELFSHTRSPVEKKWMQSTAGSSRLGKKRCDFSFPHWFIFVPWLLSTLSSACSATFVVFYSLQWGAEKSEEWLVSVGMSLFMDIFVSEPLRIIVVAFMLSHICRAGADHSTEGTRRADVVTDIEDIHLGELDKEEEDVEIPKPPSKKQLRHARTTRMRELYMYTALRNILSYIVYLWVLMIVCYGGRSEHGYMMTSSMKQTFGQLDWISNHFTTWPWARNILVPGLFEDGKDFSLPSSSPYIGDGEAVLVGMPRLRQLRVKEDSCDVVEEAQGLFNSCVAPYTYSDEDKTSFYQPMWRPFSTSGNTSLSVPDQICPTAWRYASAKQTQSLPMWGRLEQFRSYGQGGYLAEMGYDKNTSLRVISELSYFSWIDRLTSAVIVEFTVFNSHVSLFSTVWIPIEFSPSGYVASNHMIRTMHVYDIGGGYSAVTILCQVLLVFFIIYFVVMLTKLMIQDIRLFCSQFLNWIELAQTVTVIAFVVTQVLKETELFSNTAKLSENIFQFISFDKSVLLDVMESALMSLLMFLNTLKLLYLLKFNHHVQNLFYIMKRSALELVKCSFGFVVFMLTCIHVGYLLFGRDVYGFSSLLNALQTLLVQGVVGSGVDHFHDCCTVTGPIYYLIISVGLNVVCINLFISVLISNYCTARQISKGKFSLGNFMITKMKELMGCVGDQTQKQKKSRRTKGIKTVTLNVPDTESTEKTLDLVNDIARQTRQIRHSLNDLYADEFADDYELFSLWLEIRTKVKESSGEENRGYRKESSQNADEIRKESFATKEYHKKLSEDALGIHKESSQDVQIYRKISSQHSAGFRKDSSWASQQYHKEVSQDALGLRKESSQDVQKDRKELTQHMAGIRKKSTSQDLQQYHKELSEDALALRKESPQHTGGIRRGSSQASHEYHKDLSRDALGLRQESSQDVQKYRKESPQHTGGIRRGSSQASHEYHKDLSRDTLGLRQESSQDVQKYRKESSHHTEDKRKESFVTQEYHMKLSEDKLGLRKESSEVVQDYRRESSQHAEGITRESSEASQEYAVDLNIESPETTSQELVKDPTENAEGSVTEAPEDTEGYCVVA